MGLPLSALAVELGSYTVSSSLDEPLKASVELLSVTPAELASLKAKLASEQAYAEQGLTRLAVHDDIQLHIIKDSNKNTLLLTSTKPVLDAFLDLLVVAEWSNGRVARRYTLALDPFGDQSNISQIQAPAINQPDDNVITIPDVDDRSHVSIIPSTTVQEHVTEKGDTLYKIARLMQPPGVNLDQVLVAIFEANPDAFDAKNMNRLKVGKILQAPSQKALSKITVEHAHQEIKLQTADWNRYRNKLAQAALQNTADISNEHAQSSGGKIKSATEAQSNDQRAAKDVVKLSTADIDQLDANTDANAKISALQEEISAREKALKEAEERTAALEKQIQDMQKLLALKNNMMLNAQEQATDKALAASEKVEASVPGTPALESQTTVTVSGNSAPVISPKETEEKQPHFFYHLLERGLDKLKGLHQRLAILLIALLIFLVAIWLYFRSKHTKKRGDIEQGIMTSADLLSHPARKANADAATFSQKAPGTDVPSDEPLDVADFSDSPLAAEADLYFSVSDDTVADNRVAGGTDNTKAELVTGQYEEAIGNDTLDKQAHTASADANTSTALDENVIRVISSMPSLDFPTIAVKSPVMEEGGTTSMTDTEDEHAEAANLFYQNPVNENSDFSADEQDSHTKVDIAHANMFDVSGISLDMEDERSVAENVEQKIAAEELMTAEQDEVETKLELVAAYIDMGDKDSAKELLQEVLKEGNTRQRKRAHQMLASLV